MDESRSPNLILLGGGHAHVHVLESLASQAWPRVRAVLVSPNARHFYSGMVPGYLQGKYSEDEIYIDLPGLCRAAGAEFIEATAERVDPGARHVYTSRGILQYSLLSLDIGSAPRGIDLPGVRENSVSLGAMSAAVGLRRQLDEMVAERSERGDSVRVAVVGAGAGGIEIALAAHRRIDQMGGRAALLLLDRGDRILAGFSERAQRRAKQILRERGIELLLEREVVAVEPSGIHLAGGQRIPADLVVWVGGAAPPTLLESSMLPKSEEGYLRVDSTLRAVDGSPVWGAGDCVDLVGHELPKAGVFAVRQGPVLTDNLRASLADGIPRQYRPQASFLSILNTADGRALLRWHGVVLHSRPAWWLKDRIDRRFVRRYAELADG